MRRVVIDTNVVVSGLLFGGRPGEIVVQWQKRRILPLCSEPIVNEYVRVLAYPRFQLSTEEIRGLLYHEILPYFEAVPNETGEPYVLDDPEDDKFLWCALSGKADAIISGDAHLLALPDPPVPILSVQAFLKAL